MDHLAEYSIRSNPFDDNGSAPWIVFSPDHSARAYATDSDLESLGTTEEEKDEAMRGYEIACKTMALDYLGELIEAKGF